jgi:hypothetical protein
MSRHRITSGLARDLGDANQLLEQFQEQAQAVAAVLSATGDKAGGMIRDTAAALVKTLSDATTAATKAQGDIASAELTQATRQIETMLAPLDRSLDKTFMGMLAGTESLKQGMAELGQSLIAEEISLNERRLSNWVATEAAKTLASISGNNARQGAETAGAAAGKASQATTASASIFTSAKQAAAGAYAAVAPIPIIGPVLAPAAAATAFGAVLAFDVSSAAGGWDRVPADGMMTELHRDEMVLPAGLAGGLRGLVSAGGPTGPVTLNYAPSLGGGSGAMSRSDAEAFFRSHGDLMMRHLKNAWRNGSFGP